MDTVTFNGKDYTKVNGKWVDKDFMVVTHLQKTLDNLSNKHNGDLFMV